MQAAYGAVDLYVVGRFCTTSAVSAVNIGSQTMQLVTSFIIGIFMGTTVMIGRASGENNKARITRIIQCSMLIFGILSAILTLAMFLNGNAIVSLMQTPSEAIQETEIYIHYCSLGIPFIAFFNMSAGIMRGLGNSKTPMKIVGISGLCNVFGDLLLTGIFHLDVAGVAHSHRQSVPSSVQWHCLIASQTLAPFLSQLTVPVLKESSL
jgi:Na+-driven multidrug efflux pump